MSATEDNDFQGYQILASTVRRKLEKMSNINFLRGIGGSATQDCQLILLCPQRAVVPPRNRCLFACFLRLGRRNQCTSQANGGWGYLQSRRFGCSRTA